MSDYYVDDCYLRDENGERPLSCEGSVDGPCEDWDDCCCECADRWRDESLRKCPPPGFNPKTMTYIFTPGTMTTSKAILDKWRNG